MFITLTTSKHYKMTRHAEHTDVMYTISVHIQHQQHMKVALKDDTPWIIGRDCHMSHQPHKKCKEYMGVGNGIQQEGTQQVSLQYLHGTYSNLTIGDRKHQFLVVNRVDMAMPMLKFGRMMDGYLPLLSVFPSFTIRLEPEPTLVQQSVTATILLDNKPLLQSITIDDEIIVNRHVIFSIEHKQIVLPQDIYNRLNRNCPLSLNKYHNIIMHCNPPPQISLTIDNHTLPIKSELLLSNCHQDSCTMNIRVNKTSHDVILGQVLFRQYAVTFTRDGVGIHIASAGILHYIYVGVVGLFKMLMMMSLLSLFISMYYNRKRILKWMGRIGRTQLRYQPLDGI